MVKLGKDYKEIEEKLHYFFKNKKFLEEALIHRSFYNENRQLVQSTNERLEFLGDAVLSLLISEFLFQYFPQKPEGELSQLRSQLVEAASCSKWLQRLRIENDVFLGKGERGNQGKGRDSILADLFEAVLGAIYLDGGFTAAFTFFWHHFSQEVTETVQTPLRNWKAELQDYTQKKCQQLPRYTTDREEGPDHHKTFYISVWLGEEKIAEGEGKSKKEAEQVAAKKALEGIIHG